MTARSALQGWCTQCGGGVLLGTRKCGPCLMTPEWRQGQIDRGRALGVRVLGVLDIEEEPGALFGLSNEWRDALRKLIQFTTGASIPWEDTADCDDCAAQPVGYRWVDDGAGTGHHVWHHTIGVHEHGLIRWLCADCGRAPEVPSRKQIAPRAVALRIAIDVDCPRCGYPELFYEPSRDVFGCSRLTPDPCGYESHTREA